MIILRLIDSRLIDFKANTVSSVLKPSQISEMLQCRLHTWKGFGTTDKITVPRMWRIAINANDSHVHASNPKKKKRAVKYSKWSVLTNVPETVI